MRLFLLFIFFVSGLNISNEDYACKVLVKALEGEYNGDCKKGLAHGDGWAEGTDLYRGDWKKGFPEGKGKYTWANGDYYEGEFKEGMRHGEGKMTTNTAGVLATSNLSRWKNDEFVEEILEEKYKVLQKLNVSSVSIRKVGEDRDRVEIYLKNAHTLDNLDLVIDSGNQQRTGKYITIDFPTYPLNVNLIYNTLSKLGNAYDVTVKFILESKGDWRVEISNIN